MNPIKLLTGVLLFLKISANQAQNYEADFQKRVNQITNRLADTAAIKSISGYFGQEFIGPGSRPDPEKHVWPVAMARLKKYGNADTCANRLIVKYKDRAPFHFTYVGMARIMCQFPLATNMIAQKQTYLQQVWNRTDSYNPWTGEGTENHISMNKTSGYLYAQNSLGNSAFPEATNRLSETKEWIRWFSKQLYKMGNSEWNSSTYESYNMVGWLNLYDFATDQEVKDMARAVLDYYACEIALHSAQGLTSGAESRGNITGWGSGEDYISWIWFGYQGRLMGPEFWLSQEYSQAIQAALSSYRPPFMAVKIARKEIILPVVFKNSKPDYGQNIGSQVKQFLYADKGFTIGSAMIPVVGFAGGNSQYCNWKLIGRVKPGKSTNPQVVLGGSRFFGDKDGKAKTPWDQYVQHENVVIQLHKIPSNAGDIINSDTLLYSNPVSGWKSKWLTDFDLRFPNDNARNNPVGFRKGSISRNISYLTYPKNTAGNVPINTAFSNSIFFIQLDSSYLAIRTIALNQANTPGDETSLRKFIEDSAPLGSLCGLVIEAVNAIDYPSFTAFQDSVILKTTLDKSGITNNKIIYKNIKGKLLEATFTENGPAASEPIYDWGFGVTTPQLYQTTPPFLQPQWLGGAGRGKIPSLLVNGTNVGYDQSNWPVYDGPGFSIKENTLLLNKDSAGLSVYYKVDYTGPLPIFSNGILTNIQTVIESKKPELLELFPNPASHEVTAKANGLLIGEHVEILIYSTKGALVWNNKDQVYAKEGLKIPADNLKIGTYQVEVRTDKKNFKGRLILNQ
jgi:hypothetical protein